MWTKNPVSSAINSYSPLVKYRISNSLMGTSWNFSQERHAFASNRINAYETAENVERRRFRTTRRNENVK